MESEKVDVTVEMWGAMVQARKGIPKGRSLEATANHGKAVNKAVNQKTTQRSFDETLENGRDVVVKSRVDRGPLLISLMINGRVSAAPRVQLVLPVLKKQAILSKNDQEST